MHPPARDDFEFLGNLGPGSAGDAFFWLARERKTGQIVALKGKAGGQDPLTVLREFGDHLPTGKRECPVCSHHIPDWERFCGHCGSDLTVRPELAAPGAEGARVEALLAGAPRQNLEMLGEMQRPDGAPVYLARENDTQQIIALSMIPTEEFVGEGDPHKTLERRRFTGLPAPSGPLVAEERICPSCGNTFSGEVRFCSHDGSALRWAKQRSDLIGQVLADRYSILDKIGEGGMGEVYLAEHVKMGRKLALKVLNRSGADHPALVSRFAREAANASRITHPNVVTIYDFGETSEGVFYLAMEYVEGINLSRVIRRDGRLSLDRARRIAVEITSALSAAHEQGVVHRDLKPDNILIGRDPGRLAYTKVVDFGIAKAMDGSRHDLTQTGSVIGTPQYMSPEQLMGEAVDARTDIYALGCVLYEMMTGKPPFVDSESPLKLARRLTEDAPDPRTLVPDLPADFSAVVLKSLARVAADRFQTAAEMRQALAALPLDELQPTAGAAVTTGTASAVSTQRRHVEVSEALHVVGSAISERVDIAKEGLRESWQKTARGIAGASTRAVQSLASAYHALRTAAVKQVRRIRAPRSASPARNRFGMQPRVAWVSAAAVVAIVVSVAASGLWRGSNPEPGGPAGTTLSSGLTSGSPVAGAVPLPQEGTGATVPGLVGAAPAASPQSRLGPGGTANPPRSQTANAPPVTSGTASLEEFVKVQLPGLAHALQTRDFGNVEDLIGARTMDQPLQQELMEGVMGAQRPDVAVTSISVGTDPSAPVVAFQITIRDSANNNDILSAVLTARYERVASGWRMTSLKKRAS
jgi:eukaryotic-like serine/threonine-protein kinase